MSAEIGAVLAGSARWAVAEGHNLDLLRQIPDASIQLAMTSPPYFGVRDYDVPPVRFGRDLAMLGCETSVGDYLAHLQLVCEEVRRVLRRDGLFYLNIGDSHAGKRLHLVPQRLALALDDAGWIVRQILIWNKRNPPPENVQDRTTTAHEYILQLAKEPAYFYDHYAIVEPAQTVSVTPQALAGLASLVTPAWVLDGSARNRRSVLTPAVRNYASVHTAKFPISLLEPLVLSGTPTGGVCATCATPWQRQIIPGPSFWGQRKARGEAMRRGEQPSQGLAFGGEELAAWKRAHPDRDGGWQQRCSCPTQQRLPALVLDPFSGSGSSAIVSLRHGRRFIGLELSPAHAAASRRRIVADGHSERTVAWR